MLENIKSSVLKSKNISPFLVPSEHHKYIFSFVLVVIVLNNKFIKIIVCKQLGEGEVQF